MLLIKNAKVLSMAEGQGDCVLVNDGKIVALGYDLPGSLATVVDARGMYLLPGIIDAHCHAGMCEDGVGFEGDDVNEMVEPVQPELRAIDAIMPTDRSFSEAVQHGITLLATGPGSGSVVSGQFAAVKCAGGTIEKMTLAAPLALKIAFGENPKRVFSGKKKSPSTRMATAALLRQALIKAQEYAKKMNNSDPDKRPDRDLGMEALAQALSGNLIVKAHCHRADDILTALRIRDEFGLNMTLDHCTEGYLIAEELKRAGVYCILGPLICERSKIELKNLSMKAPAILAAHGVKFALMTDHPVIPIQYLPVEAALAVREGLDEMTAMRALTITAAQAIGLSDRVGSIEAGKDADFALYDGHPLDTRARVKATYIDGELVFEG